MHARHALTIKLFVSSPPSGPFQPTGLCRYYVMRKAPTTRDHTNILFEVFSPFMHTKTLENADGTVLSWKPF